MKLFWNGLESKKCILMVVAIVISLSTLHAQQKQFIKGVLIDKKSNQAVSYANVALYDATDSTLITGTISNFDGEFYMSPIVNGGYSLIISVMGYESVTKKIDVTNKSNCNIGVILLQERVINLDEAVIVGERIKAKSDVDKTTFYINKKMCDASNTGADILKHIPGIQVDIMQNISLEGSQNIIILVEGKERDRNFMSQLNAKQIDKVEVISTPDSKYDASVTGIINIILKKERDFGVNGYIYAEIPSSKSEVYIFPTYSLNYDFKKFNLYTSYNGELSYFDIHESQNRKFRDNTGTTEIISNQYVKQKNWSHRFHYGFDYFLNKKNQFNFYAFYNPYSREHDGNMEMQVTGSNDEYWLTQKEDTDINYSAFYSLYYKHIFNKPGREIAFDLSYYNFKAENTINYNNENIACYSNNQTNIVKPKQNSISIKIDYTSPITKKLKFNTGVKTKLQVLQDRHSDEFKYDENIFAAYGTFNYNVAKFNLSMGLRTENSMSGLSNSFNNTVVALLPHAAINYKLTPRQNLKLSYRRSISHPHFYQLNPYTSIDDPYTVRSGNPNLKPEFRHNIIVDYSVRFGNNYISSRLFYNKVANAINNLTFINDTNVFETRVYNLGDIHQYGIQLSGALKLHKTFAFNPYLKLFNIYTERNNLAGQYNIENRHKIAFESGFSAIVTFKNDITASILFQYKSPKNDIQSTSFNDALYFLSLEKTFKQKFKVGIISGLPFAKSFTYQGAETEGVDFYSHSEGNINMSFFPIWFKIKYQFNSGKMGNKINRTKEIIEDMPKKGF
ncbi:MAG: TonB-dependent receptor [Bacteroidetes bacterium]|nr:TonB-dependent receptor [Bacteroidota bacterium]